MVANLSVVLDLSGKICLHQFLYITGAASYYFYTLSLEDVTGPLPHVSGQHDAYANLSEDRSDSALASAAFRRGKPAASCHLAVDHIKNRIVCAMTEMVVDASL